MSFKLRPEGLPFLDQAAVRLAFSGLVPASPERVFEILADRDSWPRWFVDFKRAEATGTLPSGVGSSRRVWVGPMVLEERFIAWEPGRRYAFTMLETNLPILSAMVEDWQLSASPEGGTRVDYRVGFDIPGWIRPLKGLLLAKFGPLFEKALPSLAAYAGTTGR